jgi:hypothetical protein
MPCDLLIMHWLMAIGYAAQSLLQRLIHNGPMCACHQHKSLWSLGKNQKGFQAGFFKLQDQQVFCIDTLSD